MFSSRTRWDLTPNQLTRLLQEKRKNGEVVLDLTESNPTRCGFDYRFEPAVDLWATDRSQVYEPDPRGLSNARRALVDFYRRNGTEVDAEQIILTSGTSDAYAYLFRLLCNVGDSVLVPKPGYPLLDDLCRLNDVTPRHYSLEYDGDWHIDLQALETKLASDTKAVVLVHPNNPTGSFIKGSERREIETLARERGLALIVDEVFHSFAFESDDTRAASFADSAKSLTFTLNGLSKLRGLPQMKLAWIVVSGPEAERQEALRRLEMIADLHLSVATPIQHALPALLENCSSISRQILDRTTSNVRFLQSICNHSSPLSLFRCEGGWNGMLRLPNTRTDEEWAIELLRLANLLVHPGHLFDIELPSCMVVSLLPNTELFREGCSRILKAI